MSGTRADQAAKAAVALSEAMEAVGADYEVVDFNSSNGAVRGYQQGATYINVRKGANQSLTTTVKRQIATPFAGSQNSDGYAVKWAMNRTKQFGRPDARRMVFIISDGSPCGPSPYGMGSGQHLVQVLADAEKDDCILFSVGIAGMDTSRWYANHGHASVRSIENLAGDILLPLKVALKKALKNKVVVQ
jgi:cobalamin biosynthesis protein CobT